MIDILSLIYSKGDPTWVKCVYSQHCSPWIESETNIEIKNMAVPRLLTSHLPICLFPKSYFISKAKKIPSSPSMLSFLYEMIHEERKWMCQPHKASISVSVAYGSWFEHIKGWLPLRDSEKFLFLTYEELQQDLKVNLEKIFQFLDKELSEEEISSVLENASFQVMKNHMLQNNEAIRIRNMELFKIMVMRKSEDKGF
ncbi:sulfotransferase 2A1-like [Macrotis lagotis]|uniref:sulfotransferase 2A1-like n=1 Tax=Macrotis lagotis TaxID=92651 RepID=UPI003D69C566